MIFRWNITNPYSSDAVPSKHWLADTENRNYSNPRRSPIVEVYLDANWKRSSRRVVGFIRELVDTVNHEMVHAFESKTPRAKWRKSERMAKLFSEASVEAMK